MNLRVDFIICCHLVVFTQHDYLRYGDVGINTHLALALQKGGSVFRTEPCGVGTIRDGRAIRDVRSPCAPS